ncbi:MAG: hypothetical protein OEW08_01100 [Gammaproteobacteria bacterium]|nr:hypothetical protein [Gammaproteobacteria bacterium]
MYSNYPIPGKIFTDPQGRKMVVDSVDARNIVLRVGKQRVLVIARSSWNAMSLVELRRAG